MTGAARGLALVLCAAALLLAGRATAQTPPVAPNDPLYAARQGYLAAVHAPDA